MIKDMDREPFAKLSGTLGYIEVAGCWLVPTTHTIWPSAFVSKINATHEARVKEAVREAVAERDDRIAELDECMRQAGLQCFIPNGKPEEISKHMESVSKSWIEEKKKSEDRISELDRVLENTLQSLCVLCDFIEVEYPRNFDEEEHTLFLEDIDNMKVKIKSVLGKGKP